jgi:hypothetical protein
MFLGQSDLLIKGDSAMADIPRQLTNEELLQWRDAIAEANRNNILCHCKRCDREWVSSSQQAVCECGSQAVEYIACWQFPDG